MHTIVIEQCGNSPDWFHFYLQNENGIFTGDLSLDAVNDLIRSVENITYDAKHEISLSDPLTIYHGEENDGEMDKETLFEMMREEADWKWRKLKQLEIG